MKLASNLLGCAFVLSFTICRAASVIILDEGINTDQNWDAGNVTTRFQMCSSLGTAYIRNVVTDPPTFSYLSLCRNQKSYQVDAAAASEYQDKVDYIAFGQPHEHEIFGEDKNGRVRGVHGNEVSDALYSFDTTIAHRPVQVFGIELDRTTGDRTWRTSYIDTSKPYEEQPELPGWNIIRTLDYISRGSGTDANAFNQLTDLGAVNISVAYPGSFGQKLCEDEEGQDSVNRLRDLGIAVVAGLENRDLPIKVKSWPSCLDSVIGVGGLTGGLGVGANNINFFADNTTQSGETISTGNSFAAPRVAAAYALLHEQFPTSTWIQKFDALRAANKSRTRRTSVGTVKRPYIKKKNMNKAYAELEKVVPPAPLILPDDTLDYSSVSSFGRV